VNGKTTTKLEGEEEMDRPIGMRLVQTGLHLAPKAPVTSLIIHGTSFLIRQ
jgi:hypothetical protein